MQLPPLRERPEDIPLLLEDFLAEAAAAFGKKGPTPPPELVPLLRSYSFPGNVRELRSLVFDAVGAHQSRMLSMESFARAIVGARSDLPPVATGNPFTDLSTLPTMGEALELLIDAALERAEGNQTLAARLLGISQPALSKRLKQRR